MLMRIAIEHNGNNNKIITITMSRSEWEFEEKKMSSDKLLWMFFESILTKCKS